MTTPTLRAQRPSSFVRPGLAAGALVALTLLSGACKQLDVLPFLPAVKATSPAGNASGVHLNATITATFNEAVDAATVNATTFTLSNGVTAVPGAVSYAGVTATLVPSSPLAENTTYTATVTPGVRDLDGDPMARAKTWTFNTSTVPTVDSTSPASGATGVQPSTAITAVFNVAMDPATINATTFTLKNGIVAVPAVVTYVGDTATLTPTSTLANNTTYTATISTGAENADGIALVAAKVWSFTTGTPPTVLSTIPASAATGVSPSAAVTATFSTAMNPATINATTFTLKNGLVAVPAVVTYAGVTATLTPSSPLANNTTFTATISTGAQNVAGTGLAAAKVWSFTTGTAPTVLSTNPANAATGVATNASITATFSTAMNPATITGTTFTLKNGLVAVPAVVTYSGVTATLNPSSSLATNTTFTATISTGAQNVAGIGLSAAKVWTFTTAAVSSGPAAVNLGTAGNFVILAKSGVSTTGATAVVGDVGLSPAAATFLTGFAIIAPPTTSASSAQVTGLLYAADYDPPTPTMLNTAVLDMQAAYTDAAGRTLPDFTELGAGNIQGLNLVPGLYKWGTSVQIPSAVTLTGGANAVWIFQVAGDLVVANGAIVTLAGGAQAKNVFWQVAGQATLGTTADFKGIILSQTLISMNTGTIMVGRALAQTAVTLNATQITNP